MCPFQLRKGPRYGRRTVYPLYVIDGFCTQLSDSYTEFDQTIDLMYRFLIRFIGTPFVVIVAQNIELLQPCLVLVALSYQDARASGNTALSSPCCDMLALMRRVVNYHSSWVGQWQVELFDASGIQGSQVTQLVVELARLEVPQEVCLRREIPPRRRGRGRGQFQDESRGQNEDQSSFPSRGHGRRVEDEVDDLTTRVESMEIVMARFQWMSPKIFNGDESSEAADSWRRGRGQFQDESRGATGNQAGPSGSSAGRSPCP
ncbi:hypothetical protein F511_21883 [Dorcoceras hygrometricum]|uniref:Uncharacterized protein n=1 Tax=Dorcoceras hygrometricum TaxID=472368 RepID=A0A2Z7BQ91_9LAMI|nr:hypothetical protein F511_21883 [Dorcoceras hygrometricum]